MFGLPLTLLLIACVPLLTFAFYSLDLAVEIDRVFLSVSTFIFSIFTGFFISRQASRFNRVREAVTQFDGLLSAIYRDAGHISRECQSAVARVVSEHYNRILTTKRWNIHFQEKSTTLQDLHALLETHVVEKDVTKLANQAIGAIVKNLGSCQDVRKRMVALYEERIPAEQWLLIVFFVIILIMTVGVMPSAGDWFASLLKAAFVVSVLSVVVILYKLNNLVFSERLMGEHSALDVLGIIDNSK